MTTKEQAALTELTDLADQFLHIASSNLNDEERQTRYALRGAIDKCRKLLEPSPIYGPRFQKKPTGVSA